MNTFQILWKSLQIESLLPNIYFCETKQQKFVYVTSY
jgi:hypothetical protein